MEKLNIVLDIDNTLVDTRERQVSSTLPALRITGADLYVYKRPHLEKFLDWLFENFSVSLWTAGSDTYARWIAAHVVGPRRKLRHVLSARECQTSFRMFGAPKSLRLFNHIDPAIGPSNAVLVDDTPANFAGQERNGILVSAFDASSDEMDDELESLPAKIVDRFYKLCDQTCLTTL